MTALENVAIPLEFAGRKDAFERAEEELKLVGLGHRLTHYPGQLSGGEQQRRGAGTRRRRGILKFCWLTSRPAISTRPRGPTLLN